MKYIKNDFPIFINEPDIIYLDNASTTQKPKAVINAIVDFYENKNANSGRGIYTLADRATQAYQDARATVATFINADNNEIIFTPGATYGINFIAQSWGKAHIKKGDEIVISELEHHANLLPWQRLAQETGALLKFIPIDVQGNLDMSSLNTIITPKTKLVAITHSSNALGTNVDVVPIVARAHAVGAQILLDACQSAPHQKLDVKKLGIDFLVFSGHKLLGPMGIGVLYINYALHDDVEPLFLGGGMVFEADWHTASWLKSPYKFEAGTGSIAQAVGLAAAIDYLNNHVDFNALQKYEAQLCTRLIDGLSGIKGVRILGPIDQLKKKGHLVSFVVKGIHAHDVAAYLDTLGIAVRAGHFCAQPLAKKLGYDAAVRVSFYFYNTFQDMDALVAGVKKLIEG